MLRSLRNPKFYSMVLLDVAIFIAAFWGAYLLRFDFDIPAFYQMQFGNLLKYTLFLKIFVFFTLGLYKGMWRYTSVHDLRKVFEASTLQSVLMIMLVLYKFGFEGFSRGIFLIDWLLTFLGTAGIRMAIRMGYAYLEGHGPFNGLKSADNLKRVLVIGAGRAGERVVREIMNNPSLGYIVTGFLDNTSNKQGRAIHGIPVLGTLSDLQDAAQQRNVDVVFIAVTEASAESMREMIQACTDANLPYKVLPPLGELVSGRDVVQSLREVSYSDLLGRSQVELDESEIGDYLGGQVVLVTGCGGSIGSELVRQIIRFDPAHLVLVDASEFNLYQIEMELVHERDFKAYSTVLGSICDADLMRQTFALHKPSVVFHAAAYKHVPMLERNPWQAVQNNVFGTRTLMRTAVEGGVKRFVVVSTDKAVRPTNIMGTSKRITELLMRSFAGRGTTFMAVRFGNVLGSSGSVIPLFKRQIEQGGPVTVTHPEVTRYFMSIAEAAQLILQAGTMGHGGEIFVLDMGVPVRIRDMAEDLIRLAGKVPDKDIPIVYSGLREGEKLYEELITEGEDVVRTEHDKILVLESTTIDEPEVENGRLEPQLKYLEKLAVQHDGDGIRKLFMEMVPEYIPAENGK